jgi:hypothetical protein
VHLVGGAADAGVPRPMEEARQRQPIRLADAAMDLERVARCAPVYLSSDAQSPVGFPGRL